MNQWAIVIKYHGTEPCKEDLRAVIEKLMARAVNMDPQTITSFVLNEKDIASALLNYSVHKEGDEKGSIFDDLCTDVCIEIKKDPRIESVVNKYVLSRICCIDNAFSRNVNSIVETNLKLQFVKHIKEECNLSLQKAANIANALYDVVQKCQGRIVE